MDVFRKRRKAHIDRITLHGAQVVTRLEKARLRTGTYHIADAP